MYTQVNGLRRQGKIRVFIMYQYEPYAQVFMPCLSPTTELFVNWMPAEYSNITCLFIVLLNKFQEYSYVALMHPVQMVWFQSSFYFTIHFRQVILIFYFLFYIILNVAYF